MEYRTMMGVAAGAVIIAIISVIAALYQNFKTRHILNSIDHMIDQAIDGVFYREYA